MTDSQNGSLCEGLVGAAAESYLEDLLAGEIHFHLRRLVFDSLAGDVH